MPSSSMSKRIFLAPEPRAMSDIFDESDLARLRALGDVFVHESGPVTDALFDEKVANAEIIIGQFDLPESRLKRAAVTEGGVQRGRQFPSQYRLRLLFSQRHTRSQHESRVR